MHGYRLWRALLVFGLFAGAAEAQQGTATIRGRAFDEQKAALPGVTVIVAHEGTGIFRDTTTGPDGTYSVPNLVAGPYRITAEPASFKKLTLENIVLTAGSTQTQDLALQLGSLEESVTVTGQAPEVDVTSAAVGGNIRLTEVQPRRSQTPPREPAESRTPVERRT